MSVKFEKETVKLTEAAQSAAAGVMGGKSKDDLVNTVGQALTKGKGGANGYLAVSGAQLQCDSVHL
jgi:hypothetical protein